MMTDKSKRDNDVRKNDEERRKEKGKKMAMNTYHPISWALRGTKGGGRYSYCRCRWRHLGSADLEESWSRRQSLDAHDPRGHSGTAA